MTKQTRKNHRARIAPPPVVKDTAKPARTGDGLQNVVAGLGTERDKMSYSQYTKPLVLDRNTLENMFRSSWLARKIVSAIPEDMTSVWRTFQFDEEDVQEENQFALEEAEKALCVRQKFTEAMMWARLYGGGAIVLGVGGPNDYEKPLDPKRVKKGDLKFIHAFDRWTCIAEGVIDWDLSSPNFGKPKFYRIGTQNGPRVHHSRVIRFTGAKLPYLPALEQTGWGDSTMQAVYDTLIGRDTMMAGIATMVFEANVDSIKVEGLNDLLSTQDGEAKVMKRFQLAALMKSFNRVLLLGGGETYEKRANSFAGLPDLAREFRVEVAGAAETPVTRLFGTGVSGLAATGDNEVRSYYDTLATKRTRDLEPALNQFDEVFIRSTLGTMPDDYRYSWPAYWQLSDLDKANAQKARADRDIAYLNAGVVDEGVIARQLKEDGTYSVMTEEDVDAAEEISAALEEQRTTPGPTPEELAAQMAAGAAGGNQPPGKEGEQGPPQDDKGKA